MLYQQFGHLTWSLESRAAILFVSLLWPTFFMGVSLPLLARGNLTLVQAYSRYPPIGDESKDLVRTIRQLAPAYGLGALVDG